MKERMLAIGQRIWTDFRGFTPGQKMVTVAAVAALVIGGYFLTTWKQSPTYAPLYTNLAPADASAIVDKLNGSGISYQLGAGGSEILVPQDKVYSTRLAMSSAGLPGSADTGYALLDKEGITTSQFKQQIDYQRAIEGELAKTIMAMNGVNGASVHLAIPQDNVFSDGSQRPTAAVQITTSASNVLTSSQVQSIVYLVSSSVPGMTTAGVSVSDSNGNVLKAPGMGGASGVSDASTQAQATQSTENALTSQLQASLDAMLGPGHSHVNVTAALDFNHSVTTTNGYIDKHLAPVSETTTKQTYQGAGAAGAGGTLGTTGATNGANGSSGSGKYTNQTTTVNNALGTTSTRVESAPGQVTRLSIAVALDKNVKSLDVGAIKNLIESGSGYNAARGDTLSVQTISFDNSASSASAAASAAAAKAAAAAASQDKLMGYAKQGIFAILVLLVLGAAFISSKRRKGKGKRPPAEVEYDDEPAEPLIPAQPLAPVTDLRTVAERRRTLAATADERPQEVARVLSGWLNSKES